jgi:hypothetical protein
MSILNCNLIWKEIVVHFFLQMLHIQDAAS